MNEGMEGGFKTLRSNMVTTALILSSFGEGFVAFVRKNAIIWIDK